MKHRRWRLILACTWFAVFAAGCAGADANETEKAEAKKETAAKAPGTSEKNDGALPIPVFFEGKDIEGNEVTSDIFSEVKLTMVNVWATYCGPCLNEMPELGELAKEYEESEFQLVGIISDVVEEADQEMMDLAEAAIEKTGADYPHLLVNESLYKALLTDVTAVPTTIFLNEHGMVLDTVVGARDKADWEEIINGLLEGLSKREA